MYSCDVNKAELRVQLSLTAVLKYTCATLLEAQWAKQCQTKSNTVISDQRLRLERSIDTICKHAVINKGNFLSQCSPDTCGHNTTPIFKELVPHSDAYSDR